MKKIIRQVFGTSRPKDIYLDLLTFDRFVTRPIVHVVYWVGLGLLIIAAMAVLGVAAGTAVKEQLPWGVLLALPMLIAGWLAILVGILLWRSFCEFYLAVMSIAEDLKYLRSSQDKFTQGGGASSPSIAPQAEPAEPSLVAEPDLGTVGGDSGTDIEHDVLEDPFFRPRFGGTES